MGVKIEKPKSLIISLVLTGEDQGRYLVRRKKDLEILKKILKENNTYSEVVGTIQKEYFEIQGEMKISIKDLYSVNNKWYNNCNGTHD